MGTKSFLNSACSNGLRLTVLRCIAKPLSHIIFSMLQRAMNIREIRATSSRSLSFSVESDDGNTIPVIDELALSSVKLSTSFRTTNTDTSSEFDVLEDGTSSKRSNNGKLRPSELRKQNHAMESITTKYQTKQLEDSAEDALDLGSKGLVGREKQTKQLKDCLARMLQQLPSNNDVYQREEKTNESSPMKQLVLFSGPDGSGKAKVAKTISADVLHHKNGLFVESKFDMTTSSEPLSGIAKCFV